MTVSSPAASAQPNASSSGASWAAAIGTPTSSRSPRITDSAAAVVASIGSIPPGGRVGVADPSAATQSYLRTDASAFTDGLGGSGVSLRSRDGRAEAAAFTTERGIFETTGPGAVDVHVQGFFPLISLFGIFAAGGQLSYDIQVFADVAPLFETRGVLTDSGFTATGEDVGAIYNAHDHTVYVPPFFFDRTISEEGVFVLTVAKVLTFTSTDWTEIANAKITDPGGVSAPGIVRNGVTAVVPDVPEPASMSLLGVAVAACVARRRRSRREGGPPD